MRKLGFDKAAATAFIRPLLSASFLQAETEDVIDLALHLFNRYSLQVFDSKIVACALTAGCATLYSEDMQHGLLIENRLTIINPFH